MHTPSTWRLEWFNCPHLFVHTSTCLHNLTCYCDAHARCTCHIYLHLHTCHACIATPQIPPPLHIVSPEHLHHCHAMVCPWHMPMQYGNNDQQQRCIWSMCYQAGIPPPLQCVAPAAQHSQRLGMSLLCVPSAKPYFASEQAAATA
jgi:hypothetical protein